MWRYRSVLSRLNQLSRLYSTRISYCDMIPIDPDLMFMKKTNADILRLKKQMYALENARVKLHEQIQETIHMMKTLSNVNANQNKLLTTATTPAKIVMQEQDKQSDTKQPNTIYIDEGIMDNKMPANVSMLQPINTVANTADTKIVKMDQVQFQNAEKQFLETEAKSEAEEDEESVRNEEENEAILNAEKEDAEHVSDENQAKSVMVSMVANKESEVEGKASIIDKAAEDEELIKVILKDENQIENKESASKEEADSQTEAEEDNTETEHGINNNELEASTEAVKLNIGQQTKTIKYTDENILDVFKKATQGSSGTVFIIQKQPNKEIHELTMLEKIESDDESEPPSSQLQQGGQNTSSYSNDSDVTTQSNQTTALEVQNVQSQQEQQEQQQQQEQQLQQQLEQQEHQHEKHANQTEPAAKPAVAHFQVLDKISELLADKKINLNSSNKPIIIIMDKTKVKDKQTTLLPESNAADKNISLESEIYYKEDNLFYQESITQSNAGTEFNQIYSTIAPADDKNKKPEETIVMVTKYVPNVEQTAAQVTSNNNEMVSKMQTPKVYSNFVPKCVSQLKGMEDEQWEFEQHSEDIKSNAKTEAAVDKPGSIIQ